MEIRIAIAAHADANRALGKITAGVFRSGRFERRRFDLERKQIYVKRRLKLTRCSVDRPGIQLGSRRKPLSGRQLVVWRTERELGDRHRRDRGEVMRVKHIQKSFGDLGQFIVELEPYPPGKKRKRLDHPLDMRIFDLFLVKQQPGRDLWIFSRKISAHPPKENKLPLVIL